MNDDIFDLEQRIMDCWNVVSDIDMIYDNEYVYANKELMMNTLLGLKTLYELKFQRTFNTFETICKDYWNIKKELRELKKTFSTESYNTETEESKNPIEVAQSEK